MTKDFDEALATLARNPHDLEFADRDMDGLREMITRSRAETPPDRDVRSSFPVMHVPVHAK